MASTSSSSTPPRKHDVFLSFRGEDTRKTIVDHLYYQLVQKGIHTFRDDKGLEKGRQIAELLPIIKESRFAIVVFSRNYASSKWCLEEIATIMECQQQYGEEIMIPIFYDVEPREVGNQTGSFGKSFAEHEKRFKDDKAKVKRWRKALKDASKISGYNLKNEFNGYEGVFITKVVGDILRRLPPPSGQQNLVGLKSQLAEIRKLLEMSSTDTKLILGICGMGGIGKTTLARAIFDNIFSEFDHFSFLYDVRTNKMEDLQVKLLNDSSIHPVLYEISTIKDRLKSKKVLIVLDDVDHKEQLDKLVEDGEWLREGSRVIITTRNKQLLNSFRVVKMKCYDVKKMDEGKALELFSRHAFGKEYPDKEFEDLSRDFVAYADGLPLALKLWGSALCTNDREFWKCTLEKIKSIPGGDLEVCQKLKISYDGLDEDQKKIFLNIACFFRHKRWDHVKDALESCGLHPGNGIKVLIKKCLLFESRDGNIDMHDLIQDMGWYVANQEKPRTRLWQRKDVESCRKMEPKHKELIEGFLFSSTNNRTDDEKTLRAVKEMTNLKILIVGGADENFPDLGNFLPRSLRWLDFLHYNSRSLPNTFHPSLIFMHLGSNPLELVGFCVPHSSLLNCRITKRLDNLTYLDLSYSRSLSKTPNFKWIPNLKRLYLSYCVELEKIHPSIGNLHKLVLLDLSDCYKLKNLPTFIQVSSLQFLKLEHCGALQNFPEIQTNMPDVEELNLESIGIEELPSSILKLCGLTKLRLCGCDYLVSLSDDLCEFKSLKILELRNCGQLESLPENLGNLSNLEELLIFDTAIFQLPPSITQLSSLECLCWGGNPDPDEERSLKFVPSVAGLCSLKRLQLSYFNIIDEGLPSDLEYLNSLEYLSLGDSNFVDLPESFSKLPCLQYLNIKGCRQLNRREEEEQPDLPKLPESTRELYADIRFASRRNITKLLAECPELHAVAFCNGGNDPAMRRPEYFLARMCTRFPLPRIPRETPFSVSYSVVEEHPDRSPDESLDTDAFRLFQYRCYQSNGISIDLTKHSWYCGWFVGFAVYFIYSGFDIWGPHSFKDIHCVERCTVIAKVSHNNNRNKDRQRECVIVNADDYTCEQIKGHICFVYIPFSSLCPESSTNTESVTAKDFSRFEVKFKNLEETADWGCSLLYYKRRKRLASRQDICSCSHRLPREKNICPDCAIHDLGPLPMLEYMNLSRQKFEDVPQYISKLHVIQYLDISGCLRVGELPELPLTLKELYAPCNRSLASENNITELATKYSELSSVSFSSSIDDNDDDRAFLKPRELAEKFIPITQPFLNRNTPFAVSYPNDDYKIGKCFKYTHNDSNKISISLDPTWYNHSFVGFVVCFQFPIKVRWESHPAIRPFRHCELIAKLTHKDINGSEPDPLQTKCVIGRLYDEEFYGEHGELVCFAYIPFSSLWPKYEVITDTTTPNRYSVFEAAFQDSEISKGISTDWSCGLLYTDDKSLIEELQQKRENGSSESDSEEEEEEEEEEDDEDEDEDDGSQHEDDAMTEDNNLGHSAESPIDISDDGSEPSEHGDSGKEGESIDCDEDVDEFESDAGHSSGAAMAKHRAEMQSNEGRGIRVKRSGVKTCIGSPPTKKRSHGLSPNVPFDGEEDGAGHGAEVAMSEYNDSVNEKGKERENEQRKKVRLNNDKAPSSSKQNRKIRDQSDELSPTGTQPPIVGDDVLQQMWDNFNCLLASFPLDEEYIKLEIDQTIFHHTDTCSTFMLITDIKDMMKMDFIDASIIKLFILFLNRLCNQFQVTSIGFVCPVEISMNEVKQNVPDITPYLTHVMEQHKNKQFILAPYLQKSHWLLLVICISSKSIYVLDPKPHNRTIEIKNNLNRALHSVSTNERNINWKPCKCPIQPGGVECGYYVMRYMFDIVTKYSSFECLDEAFESNNQYSINEINEIRDLWVKYFLEECIQTEEGSVFSQLDLVTGEAEHSEQTPVDEDCEAEVEANQGTGEAKQSEPNPANEDCEAAQKSVLTQLEHNIGEAEQSEPNPANEDFQATQKSVLTQLEPGIGEAEQSEPNLTNEDCEATQKSVLTQLEPRIGVNEQSEPNPTNEDCEATKKSVFTQLEPGTGEAEQSEPNLANEDCEAAQKYVLTQLEHDIGEADQSEPNPTTKDCDAAQKSALTQLEPGTRETQQSEQNPANEDCEATQKSLLTQLEPGIGEAEQSEPNPTNEDCEAAQKSVLTQLEPGTGEAELSEPNPINEDCEAAQKSVLTQREPSTREAEQSEPNLANEDCEAAQKSMLTQLEPSTGEAEVSEPNLANEDCEAAQKSVLTQLEPCIGEAEQSEPNPTNEDCEATQKSKLTQLEPGTREAEQSEPNPANEDCEASQKSVLTQLEHDIGESEQSEPNPANEDFQATQKFVLTQLEPGIGEAEHSEPNLTNEDCEATQKSVLTQLEPGTGEAEQSEQNPTNEDCEAKVHSNKCGLIRCFWKCC